MFVFHCVNCYCRACNLCFTAVPFTFLAGASQYTSFLPSIDSFSRHCGRSFYKCHKQHPIFRFGFPVWYFMSDLQVSLKLDTCGILDYNRPVKSLTFFIKVRTNCSFLNCDILVYILLSIGTYFTVCSCDIFLSVTIAIVSVSFMANGPRLLEKQRHVYSGVRNLIRNTEIRCCLSTLCSLCHCGIFLTDELYFPIFVIQLQLFYVCSILVLSYLLVSILGGTRAFFKVVFPLFYTEHEWTEFPPESDKIRHFLISNQCVEDNLRRLKALDKIYAQIWKKL